jgi:putative ABC transport system ATP-binding protein
MITNREKVQPFEPDAKAVSLLPVLEARDITKVYRRGVEEVRAVDGVSFTVERGEFVAIVGPSGAGKTTLLQLIGAMDVPTSGSLCLMGSELQRLPDGELTRLRRDHIGFVFQHFSLLPTLSVAENVGLPASFRSGQPVRPVSELLERVGMSHRSSHRPAQLSGGEMHRTAIARALVNDPKLLLADEPTGNLDSATSERILDLFQTLNREGLTIVVVTHNATLAGNACRRIILRDGRIAPD